MDLKVKKVSLFKNGLGFLTSSGEIPSEEKTIKIGQIPVPSFGTFWISYEKGTSVKSLVTEMESVEEDSPLQNISALLAVNVGKNVILTLRGEKGETVSGTILRTMETEPAEPRSPYFMDFLSGQQQHRSYYQNILAVMLKTESGVIALNTNEITLAKFADDDVATTSTITRKRPSLRLELNTPSVGKTVSVSSLAKGMTWLPSYHIDLSDPVNAKFSAKALIMNEIMDIENVSLDLVTGFPNIKFADVLSPLAMNEKLSAFLNSLEKLQTPSRRDGPGGMMMRQSARYAYDDYSGPLVPNYSAVKQGTVSEDLFLYPIEKFSLKKDETACVPLFTAEMPYKHIYVWKIGDYLNEQERYTQPGPEQQEEIWHSCKLTNTLDMPLTTAAAEFVSEGQFVGQDICYYTAPKSDTTIRINKALNVLAEQAEYEVERERNKTKFYGYHYDLVKVRGELKVKSLLSKPIKIEITKDLSGQMLENPNNAKDVKTAKGLKRVNERHILTWTIDLAPGAEQKLSYLYEVYVRS